MLMMNARVESGSIYEMFYLVSGASTYQKQKIRTEGRAPAEWRLADTNMPIPEEVANAKLLGCVKINGE